MKGTRIGNRVVVIGRSLPANEKVGYLQPAKQRPTTRRIVVIKNGELVGSQPRR